MVTAFVKVTLYETKINSPILDPLLRRNQNFTIGSFEFRLREEQENTADSTLYDITNGDIKVTFKIITIDTSIECGPRSCLNFAEFIWNNLGIFIFEMYAIVAVPFDTPKILYLQHHRAASDG